MNYYLPLSITVKGVTGIFFISKETVKQLNKSSIQQYLYLPIRLNKKIIDSITPLYFNVLKKKKWRNNGRT